MTALESDLAPVYGPQTDLAAGMSRWTLNELRVFFDRKKAELDRISGECADCAHKRGVVCKKFGAIPTGYTGADCGEWAYDGCPF